MLPETSESLQKKISANLTEVRQSIVRVAERAGREPSFIKLVVVTKRRPLAVVRAAVACGITCFGENYPEEGEEKILALPQHTGLSWHMIGHIQSRKANIVCEYYDYVHSVDSMKVAGLLDKHMQGKDHRLPVLLEVNISGEVSKYGFTANNPEGWHALLPEFRQIAAMPGLHISGLMSMPPLFQEAEGTRPYFQKVKRFQTFLQTKIPDQTWDELSMGTSSDYQVAIEEGATMVRIGEAILGPKSSIEKE